MPNSTKISSSSTLLNSVTSRWAMGRTWKEPQERSGFYNIHRSSSDDYPMIILWLSWFSKWSWPSWGDFEMLQTGGSVPLEPVWLGTAIPVLAKGLHIQANLWRFAKKLGSFSTDKRGSLCKSWNEKASCLQKDCCFSCKPFEIRTRSSSHPFTTRWSVIGQNTAASMRYFR